MKQRRLYFVRHGLREDFQNAEWKETAENPWDPPLSLDGRAQAADIGAYFAGKTVQRIYASPFLRTLETAAAISEACGTVVWMEQALCEWLNPVWHQQPPRWLNPDEAAARFPGVDPSYASRVFACFPEKDQGEEVRARCQLFLAEILADDDEGDLVFVTHGSPLGQCMTLLLGHADEVDFRMAAITELLQNGRDLRLLHSGCEHLNVLDEIGRFV